MQTTGNTILITGGGSGIGLGLAKAFLALGNKVIIAGRRRNLLDEVTAANPGMKAAVLNVEDPADIRAFAAKMATDFPTLNVLINNAGIMRPENLKLPQASLADAEATITTNLLGPIRLTAALLPLLQKQPRSVVMNVTSGLAFVPKAVTPTYCASKAAIHSFTMSLRHQLRDTTTEVLELIPPYVQTDLTPGQATDPRALPLDQFIQEVMAIITKQPEAKEIVVERCKVLRFAAEAGTVEKMFSLLASQD
jgi:uncharacterized oxidoreductase